MSLRRRLILSYGVIILMTLTLAFLTLIIIARPIQTRLARVRLTAQINTAAAQFQSLYQDNLTTDQIIERLNSSTTPANIRLLLVDSRGTILTDNQAQWQGQMITLPPETDGTVTGPDNQVAQYTQAAIDPPEGGRLALVGLVPRPRVLPGVITDLGGGFLFAGLVALLASFLIGVLIARSIARPLQEIARAATAVASGDYSHRLPERGPPEIRRVSSSFNTMARQVEASQRVMRDFVSNVSHELKTPLTSIQGFSQAMMEGATQDEAARKRAAAIIHEEAGRMSRLVEDLLDLARIDSGQVIMHKVSLDLAQILTAAIERLRPQAAEKDIELVQQWDDLPSVVGDGDRLAQVFTNLLDNAVRHTPPGGRITLAAEVARDVLLPRRASAQPDAGATTAISRRGPMAQISISDTGPGIPPPELARIFERFYQVDKSRRRGSGTGLGLAIIKEIIDAHSGLITARSSEGAGTTFTILLPLTEADARTLISPKPG